jgi:glycosyltransferase involved in cell wall biosynthesis
MSKKKLAIFVAAISGGGVEKVIVNLVNEFVKKGIAVDLLIADTKKLSTVYISSDVKIIDLKSKRVLFCIPKLIFYLIKTRPYVLFSAMDYVNIIAIISKLISCTSTRIVVSNHAKLEYFIENEKLIKFKILKKLTSYLYARADKVIAVSKGLEIMLIKELNLKSSKVSMIYNPIYSESLLKASREDAHDSCAFTNTTPYIISVGRFALEKDYPTLIYAFNEVRKKRDIKLIILGDGPQWDSIQKLIKILDLKNHICTPGFLINPYPLIRNSACFVLSSVNEGFGNVLVEALTLGTPIVSTNCFSGPSEILENGRWGALVPIGDYNRMAKSIIAEIDNKQNRNESLLSSHLEKFTISLVAEKYIQILFSE